MKIPFLGLKKECKLTFKLKWVILGIGVGWRNSDTLFICMYNWYNFLVIVIHLQASYSRCKVADFIDFKQS